MSSREATEQRLSESGGAERAAGWNDIAAKRATEDKFDKGPEGQQDSAESVPGHEHESKLSKLADPAVQDSARNGDEPGEGKASSKIKKALKGYHPET